MDVCRLCSVVKSSDEFDISLQDNIKVILGLVVPFKEFIEYHCRISLDPNPDFPQRVCQLCQRTVITFSEFSYNVEKQQLVFAFTRTKTHKQDEKQNLLIEPEEDELMVQAEDQQFSELESQNEDKESENDNNIVKEATNVVTIKDKKGTLLQRKVTDEINENRQPNQIAREPTNETIEFSRTSVMNDYEPSKVTNKLLTVKKEVLCESGEESVQKSMRGQKRVTRCEKSPEVWHEWILNAIMKIKSQKQSANFQRICHAIKTIQNQQFPKDLVADKLNQAVKAGAVIKVCKEGVYSYKLPS